MIKSCTLFFFLLLLYGCASDRQLSDDICFSHSSALYQVKLKISKDGNFYIEEIHIPTEPAPAGSVNLFGKWQLLENNQIILIFDTNSKMSVFREFQNSKTLQLNTVADSLQLADSIWLYRTTCELKGVRMRRGTIDSAGVFRRDK